MEGKCCLLRPENHGLALIAWPYPDPFPEFEPLKDYLAFYPQHLDCYIDGIRVKAQTGEYYAGWITPDLTGPFKGENGAGQW